MFETLLEKLLLSKLGKYISGLDRENLKVGVWQGDIILNNVHLNPESLLRLQLPFILSVGMISELVIKIPWTRLSSSPIEISLNGLYILLHPQEKQNWEYSEHGEILKRKDMLDNLEKKTEDLTPEEEVKKKGFMEKLMGKIIDNIKITIKNIHIRLEFVQDSREFSVGFCLESIESYTTDENWTSCFTDRHQVKNANLAIYKILKITGLSMYWIQISSKSKQAADKSSLQNFKDQDYLIKPSNL